MLRALRPLPLVALLALLPVGLAAQETPAIDGTAMVDYSQAPDFEVGSWVRYHTVIRGAHGDFQEYWTTLIISGEERFWGDRGFWLETITEDPGDPAKAVASLVTYEAFGDTAAARRPVWFQRKIVREIGPDGEPEEVLQQRDPSQFKIRAAQLRAAELDPNRPPPMFDTLGVDTTVIPLGTYRGAIRRERTILIDPRSTSDSTIEVSVREVRLRRMSDEVPITHLVREDVENIAGSKRWKTGFSSAAVEEIGERAIGTTTLVAFGKGNHPPLFATPVRARGKRVPPDRSEVAAPSARPAPSAARPRR